MHNSPRLHQRLCPMLAICLAPGLGGITAPALGQPFNETVKLLPNSGAEYDYFGASIAVSDGIVVVGLNSTPVEPPGSNAYLFDAATGMLISGLSPISGKRAGGFGRAVALSDGVAVIGARKSNDNGIDSGSVFLFDAKTGVQTIKLLPDDGAPGDFFGISIAIDDGIVVVGAPGDDDNGTESGSAYVFDAITGVQIAKLLPLDGAEGVRFGSYIAIDNGMVAVGALWENASEPTSGSVYVFDAATGDQIAKLLPDGDPSDDHFGVSVAIDGGIVAVGAQFDSDNGEKSGAAYLFDAATGDQIAKLFPPNSRKFHKFGRTVAIDDGIVAVGTISDDAFEWGSGAVFLFDAGTGTLMAKLLASDTKVDFGFSYSVAIKDGVVAVGAVHADNFGFASGAAYVFDLFCPADMTFDFELGGVDVAVFLGLFMLHDPRADLTGDGVWDFFDVQAYLTDYAKGCTKRP